MQPSQPHAASLTGSGTAKEGKMVPLSGEGAPCLLGFLFSLSHGTSDGLGIPSHLSNLQSLRKHLLSLFAGEEKGAHAEGCEGFSCTATEIISHT